MRAWLACLALLGLAGAVQAGEGLRIEVEPGLGAREADATQRLVEDVLDRLPPRWREQGQVLRLAWRDDLPEDVHGRIRGDRILLSRGLLEQPGAPASRDAATAALLHELAHAWDRQHGLSRDPRLLDLAGWQVRPLWPRRARANAFAQRSPDLYELHSPAEFVAVNLEHFVLDPSYACRRPALHGYFSAHFGGSPEAAACAPTLPLVDAGALADAGASPLLELDPARVVAVDYLLAGNGEAMASRWGHTMLRLVVCAPGRAPGPDCRLDLDHHRVLSFRAHVDDLQLSSWRGLTGGYPSRLFVLPLQQVVDEYTRVELRPLESFPLRLGRDDVAALVARAAQVHWSYDGRYRFVGNNCAVETWRLLHDALAQVAAADLSSITPRGLLRRLRRAGLVDDAQVPDEAAEARRLGYRFEPWTPHYQALYDTARERLALEPVDVGDWLRLEPTRRAPWLRRGDMRASAALLLLEEAALLREEQRARDALKRLVFQRQGLAAAAGVLPLLHEAMREGGAFASPAALVSLPGYGLPQSGEREQARAGAEERATRLRALETRLQAAARAALPQRMRESLAQAEANVATLGEHLRQLHAEAGGLQLDPAPPTPAPPPTL